MSRALILDNSVVSDVLAFTFPGSRNCPHYFISDKKSGRILLKSTVIDNKTTIDVSAFPAGIYLLTIIDGGIKEEAQFRKTS